jgi:hypothetical protein
VGVWLTAVAGWAWGRQPSVTLLVVAADSKAEPGAARVFGVARQNMQQTRSFAFVAADGVLARGRKAVPRASGTKVLYRRGREAYDNLELNQAVKLLKRAASDLDACLGEVVDLALFTDIYAYWGSALVLKGKKQQGEKVYRTLLIFQPKAELDPLVFPPSLSAIFNRVSREVQRSGTGSLRIDSAISGTEVWVDGIFRGINPVRLERLVKGEHIVRLVRRGYQSWGRKYSVIEGSQGAIRQGLEPLPGLGRMEGLGAQLASAVRTVHYPEVADELMDWMGVDRMFFILVGTGADGLMIRAFYYDRHSRSCLKARKKVFNPSDPSFGEMVNLFCTALYMDVSGQVIAGTGLPTGGGTEIPIRRDAGVGQDSSGSSWWLWTAIGVVAAGGVGLALYFILGGQAGPADGEVIFSF